MKLDELAYLNQQLAGMLKSGIPLEGALRQICGAVGGGPWVAEFRALESDLASGTPLRQALTPRRLPEFYKQMVLVGAESNDLPAVLTLLADHFQRLHFTWTRLKGLLFYPLLVLVVSFAVSILVALLFTHFTLENANNLLEWTPDAPMAAEPSTLPLVVGLWAPVVLLGLLCLAILVILSVPSWRHRLRWRMPGFKEAGLSHFASAVALMLQNGCGLPRALALLSQLETGSALQPELAQWQSRLAAGQTRFSDMAAGGRVFPPLFVWLVAAGGEDLASGFRQAAQVYYERALQRVEMLLYAALPISVLVLAFLIVGQIAPMLRVFTEVMRGLGGVSGIGE